MVSLQEILNADLHEILELHISRKERKHFNGFYISILKHYLTNDLPALARILDRIESCEMPVEEKRNLSVLGRARFAARKGSCGEGELRDLLEYIPEAGPLRGEFFFVLALCFESMNRVREMSDAYLAASQEFKRAAVHGKSVKALFNHLAAEHRLHPEKKFLHDFQFCYREAKKHKVHSTAGMALVNLSREYQVMGAFDLALKFVNRALALLDRQRYARSHFLALAHRSHVLLCLGRKREALEDFREAEPCSFPDVKDALATIQALLEEKATPSTPPALQSWEGRVRELDRENLRKKMGLLEQRLIEFLAERPRTRWELIEFLYGGNLAPEVLENRFNNTLQRIKKKIPGVIVNVNGKYSLAEELVEYRYKRNA